MTINAFSGNYNHIIYESSSKSGIPSGLSACKNWNIGDDDYKMRSLCATGDIDIVAGKSPYEVLINKQRQDPVFKYEHLPLIWSVITDNFAYISSSDRQYIKDLLNCAPACGPYKFSATEYGNEKWSSPTRLIWPERLGANDTDFLGYYNGLDYMLLHNLYWLANIKQYPANLAFQQWSITGGMLPLNGIATNQVTCSSPINTTLGKVNLVAGQKVLLNPGFSVFPKNGLSGFSVRIANGITNGENPLFYQKVSLAGYPSCGAIGL
jgi:hypothetical protein